MELNEQFKHNKLVKNNYTFTGTFDTNVLILMELSGDDLLNLCLVDKNINNICHDKDFWLMKFQYDNLPGEPSLHDYKKINNLTKIAINIISVLPDKGTLFINAKPIVNIKPILLDYYTDIDAIVHSKTYTQQIYITKLDDNNYNVGVINWSKNYRHLLNDFQYNMNKTQAITVLIRVMYYLPKADIMDADGYSFIKRILIKQIDNRLVKKKISKNSTIYKKLMKRVDTLND